MLQMKSMGINQVVGFPFPTLPPKDGLVAAEKLLKNLGALDIHSRVLKITELGTLMAQFPVSPRYARMLIVAARQSEMIVPYIICIVAGLSVGDPFIRDSDLFFDHENEDEDDDQTEEKEERTRKRGKFFKVMHMFAGTNPTSDVLCMLKAIGAYSAELIRAPKDILNFCHTHFLNLKSMQEIEKLRGQVSRLFKLLPFPHLKNLTVDPRMSPPNAKQQALIRQIILCGFGDQVAKLNETKVSGYGKNALPLYETMWSTEEEEFILHPSSTLFRQRPPSKFIIYDQVIGKEERFTADGSEGIVRGQANKRWLKGITVIDASWISKHPSPLCSHGRILEQPEPKYSEKSDCMVGYTHPTYGPKIWQLPLAEQTLVVDQHLYFAKAVLEGKVGPSPSVFSILLVFFY